MRMLKQLVKNLKIVSKAMMTIVNTLLLSIVYIIGIGITAVIAKLTGKHFLSMSKKKKTYWSDLNLKKNKEGYYRQF